MISLKEEVLESKHQKMNNLVREIFKKQPVSPKTFEIKMSFLTEKQK